MEKKLPDRQTHEKRRHYGPVDGVEQMGVYAHPTATTGWRGRNTSVSSVQNTHTITRKDKHALFVFRSLRVITHLSSKYFFLATAWMDAGTRGKPLDGKEADAT